VGDGDAHPANARPPAALAGFDGNDVLIVHDGSHFSTFLFRDHDGDDGDAGMPALALTRHCPAGIDVAFENVGGSILDAVLAGINLEGPHRALRIDLAVQRHRARTGTLQLRTPARAARA